jgi:PleD family two-component response regulator
MIENTPCHHAGTEIRITASFGSTTFSPLNESIIPSAEHLLKVADRLLYEAKQAGRNRIITGMY